MAKNILTPSSIWDKIVTDSSPSIESIGEYKDKNVVYSRFYLVADFGGGKSAKIYCSLARDITKKQLPTIFVVQDFNDGADESILSYFVKKGYAVFTFDFAGKCEGSANRTIYSKKLDFANFNASNDKLSRVEDDVTNTCWNVWAKISKQALEYIKGQPFVSKLGALGIGEASTVLWQLVAMTDDFTCSVFVKNAGWQSYKNYFKFGDEAVPHFTDEQMAYIAGVEAQNYALMIDCPTLVLSPTNSAEFDLDRANDTANRLSKKTYSAVDYSVGMRDSVGIDGLIDMQMFFDKYLRLKDKIILPNDVEIKSSIEDGKLKVSVFPDLEQIEKVYLYVAEEEINPALRCWVKHLPNKVEGEEFTFLVEPYYQSEFVAFFARAIYKNGFTICSAVYGKEFKENELGTKFKSNIVYSSREIEKQSIFTPARENNVRPTGVNLAEERMINVVQGPDEIVGVNCYGGVLTFNVNTKRCKPSDDAMLMLDVFIKESGVLTVKLISDYLGNRVEYTATEKLNGGEIWHKIRLDKSKFKTAEGRPLKNYDKIEAIEIDAFGYYLVNNILWV